MRAAASDTTFGCALRSEPGLDPADRPRAVLARPVRGVGSASAIDRRSGPSSTDCAAPSALASGSGSSARSIASCSGAPAAARIAAIEGR